LESCLFRLTYYTVTPWLIGFYEDSFQFFQRNRRVFRFADAAVERIIHNDGFVHALLILEYFKYERHLLCMFAADGASAKATGAMRGSVTVPAFHDLILRFFDLKINFGNLLCKNFQQSFDEQSLPAIHVIFIRY